jgi:hypothetical protein
MRASIAKMSRDLKEMRAIYAAMQPTAEARQP